MGERYLLRLSLSSWSEEEFNRIERGLSNMSRISAGLSKTVEIFYFSSLGE